MDAVCTQHETGTGPLQAQAVSGATAFSSEKGRGRLRVFPVSEGPTEALGQGLWCPGKEALGEHEDRNSFIGIISLSN